MKRIATIPCRACGHPMRVVPGDWLYATRHRAGVTLEAIAKRMQPPLTASYLCDLELGRRVAKEALVERWEKALKEAVAAGEYSFRKNWVIR